MNPAEPFPLHFPPDARRPFGSDGATRRFAKVAQLLLERGRRVLELGAGPLGAAGLLLARDYGCSVTLADTHEPHLASLRARVKAEGLEGLVEVRRVDPNAPGLPERSFDAILVQGPVLLPLSRALRTLRPLLVHYGRLGLTYPARVGRVAPRACLDFWEERLGEPLHLPRELLLQLESTGFEPQSMETLQDDELDALYSGLEPHLGSLPAEHARWLREEITFHREQAGSSATTYAFLIGRRKEPGEKPPATRDRG